VGYTNLKGKYIMTKDDQLTILGTLDKLALNEAKTKAMEILNSIQVPPMTDSRESAIQKRASVNKLKYDIQNANTSKYVCESMWGPFLSKEGLGVMNSAWKKHYKGI
jgi:hypothetical protein